jgi:hypothetical protein
MTYRPTEEAFVRASTTTLLLGLGLELAGISAGCNNPPPPRIQVPSNANGSDYSTYRHDQVKPLPPQEQEHYPAAPNSAPPAATPGASAPAQAQPAPPAPPPVSQDYLDAYDRVGRPRLMIVVQPADTAHALVPGDYDAIAHALLETLSANGQVAVVPNQAVAQELKPPQMKAIVDGDKAALAQAGQLLRADVVIAVGVEAPAPGEMKGQVKISAVARNSGDGQTLATVTSTLPSPPQRRQIDFAGRLLGQQMIDELAGAWDRLSAAGATQPSSGTREPSNPASPPAPTGPAPSAPSPTGPAQSAPSPTGPAPSAPAPPAHATPSNSTRPATTAPEPADLSTPQP